jgi:hypothetical protein
MHGGHPFLRTLGVVLLAAWAIGSDVPQLAQLWHTYGSNPNFAASAYGENRDWRSVSLGDRLLFTGAGIVAAPDVGFQMPTVENGIARVVSVTSVPQPFSTSDAVIAVLCFVGDVLFVVIGGWLVLIRPTPITWAFFAFGAIWGPADWFYSVAILPPQLGVFQELAFFVLAGPALWGGLYFSLMFPSGAGGPLKLLLARWSWVAWPLVTLQMVGGFALFDLFGISETPLLSKLGWSAVALIFLGSIFAMTHTFVISRGLDRQRVKWVYASFTLGVVPLALIFFSWAFGFAFPLWIDDIGFLMTVFLPFAVAYTVIVHRVLDVNFIISRALVYGVLTSVIVGIFGVIDWFVGKVLVQTQLALVAEIAVAIALGFGLNGLHANLDRLIDATLFRDRHRAERRLARVADAVAHVGTVEAVEDMLVSEPAEALRLASAAVFRRDAAGIFSRTASVHWQPGDATELGPDERLVALLRAEQGALGIDETGWNHRDLPHGAARPIVAIPILVRHELRAIAFYGAHASGEAIDPDELRLVEKIAKMSSAAIDHLEAMELRRQNESLARELARYCTSADPASP